MKNKIRAILLLFLFPIGIFAQTDEPTISKKEARKERPAYIGISLGASSSSFRDFATSPLFYKGAPMHISLSRHRLDYERESDFGLSYSFGKYKNKFNNHLATSSVNTVSFSYLQLYQLNSLNTKKLNVKVGGLLNTTGNLRINGSFQNNAGGIEIFSTLFGSIKITKDLSRNEDMDKKFLFIKYKLKQRTRDLAFNLNIGLMNNSYRNGYVYSGQSSVLNKERLFDRYELKVFSGFRISSALNYSIFLRNRNKVQLSYLWDAYKTGGDLDKFEMAFHTLRLTLLFNTNNK